MAKVMRKQEKVDLYNFPYTLNPYEGCSFRCNYCYSINFSKFRDSMINRGIQPNTPQPKKDVVQRLQKELQNLTNIPKKDKEVQTGNFIEPYPHIEKTNMITRQCLEEFAKYPDWIVHLITKSELITRDIDVFKKIPNFQAEITITTLTHDKHFEPYAPNNSTTIRHDKDTIR